MRHFRDLEFRLTLDLPSFHHGSRREANHVLPQDTTALALAIASTLTVIWLLLPNILAVVGLINVRNGIAGGPQDADGYCTSRIDEDMYREMLALGFQPEGIYREQMPFGRRFEEFVFTRRGEQCFGVLYPNDQIMPRRGSFITVFETGGVVFTKNYCGGVEIQQDDFLATGARTDPACDPAPPPAAARSLSPWMGVCLAAGLLTLTLVNVSGGWPTSGQRFVLGTVSGLVSAIAAIVTLVQSLPRGSPPRPARPQPADLDLRIPLAETLARHRLNVNRLIAGGQELPPVFNAEEFVATQLRYHRHPRLRRAFQSAMLALLLMKLSVLAPLPAILLYTRGADDPLPWTVLLVEGLAGLYLRYGCSSATVVKTLRGVGRDRSSSKEPDE
jgi:hypothetical protein